MSTILVVDDKASMRKILQQKLGKSGFDVIEAEDEDHAVECLKNNSIDLILTDVRMKKPDGGIELLKITKRDYPYIPVILMSAYATVPQAVQAVKDGAEDYIERPYSIDALMVKIEKALQKRHLIEENRFLTEENRLLRDELHLRGDFTDIIGKSKRLQDVLDLIRKVAKTDSSVLIQGETGTGKELIALAIHNNSARRDKPFIRADCATYAEGVLESELFGHEKGAFTNAIRERMGRFELANGGTIFLDEIGDISPQTQLKLLRVLQDKTFERVGGSRPITVDVRIIAATNKNLEEAVRKGTFRQDLYYRINVVPIYLPPLRERREDIPDLVYHFIKKLSGKVSNRIKHVSPEAMELLINYEWRGNIRELEHTIERAMVFADGDTILPEHLPLSKDAIINQDIPKSGTLEEVEKLEKKLILEALQQSNWVRTKAANILGIKRSTLNYKMEKHGITSPIDDSNE
ncbi:TPA: sigma-54-dependent Fis family transcriptional regulator [Candidatus Poribacteria bacterium]|nr:sigma-54-dependent Fis family transcriptional regulator [Candidatus Poribacteria bacterium]